MGTTFGSSAFHDNQHELTVFGYIREQTQDCNDLIIPRDIQRICSNFYYQDWYMYMTIGSLGCTRKDFNSLQCINIKSGKIFDFTLKDLENKESDIMLNDETWDKMFYGQCLQQNILLPQWILNKTFNNDDNKEKSKINMDPHHRYNILYRIGGASGKNLKLTDTADCIIYNVDQFRQKTENKKHCIVNGYYYNLPSIQQPMTSVTSILDTNKNRIYAIGRTEFGKNYIHELDLNNLELQWNRHEGILKSKIFGVALTMLNKTNYNQNDEDVVMMMCGGRNISRNTTNNVDIINLTTKSVINMKPMIHPRSYFNCIPWRDNNEFIVGGGYDECKTLEIFDIIKDEWRMIPQETNYPHEWNSCLWNDICNENIIYICGKKLGYNQLRDLGYIEFCDLRENTNQFKLLKKQSMADLFGIKGSNINDKWEARSLFI